MTRFGALVPHFDRIRYDATAKLYLDRSGHYLQNAPPGCLLAFAVRERGAGLGLVDVGDGPIRGLLLLGRPVARAMAQDGSVAEITRLVIDDGFPKGTASALVRFALASAWLAGITRVDALHDRGRHSGCVYRKAGMRKVAQIAMRTSGWESRPRSASAIEHGRSAKTRWSISRPSAPTDLESHRSTREVQQHDEEADGERDAAELLCLPARREHVHEQTDQAHDQGDEVDQHPDGVPHPEAPTMRRLRAGRSSA